MRGALIASIAAAAVLVSGCGGSSSSTSSTSSAATATTATTSAGKTTAATTSAGTTTSGGGGGSAASGKTIFVSHCGACHTLAAAGTSGSVGPVLDKVKPSDACVIQQVTNGGAVKPPCPPISGSIMPPFSGVLSKAQIEDVAKFVSTSAGHA